MNQSYAHSVLTLLLTFIYIYIYKQSITLNHQNLAERIKYKSAETQVLLRNDQ
jgi:hypothetical protein